MLEIPVQYQKYISSTTEGTDNDRTGGDVKLKATSKWMNEDSGSLTVQANLDGQYTSGKNYRQVGLDLPVTWATRVPYFRDLGLMNAFSFQATGQLYLQDDVKRRDVLLRVGTGLSRPIVTGWNASLDYNYLKNISTVLAARYTKGIITLQLVHEFL